MTFEAIFPMIFQKKILYSNDFSSVNLNYISIWLASDNKNGISN